MSSYILMIVWVAFYALLSNVVECEETVYVNGKKETRYTLPWVILGVVPLILFATFRSYGIGDTGTYMKMYSDMPNSFLELPSYMSSVSKDRGFFYVSALIRILLGSNVRIYFFIIAVFQAVILVSVYRKYTSNFILTLFLFIASTDYISWLLNGIRQFTAVVITFLALKYILEKKYVPAVIISLIASLFHGTALLIIPFIFIAQGKAWNKRTVLFILLVIIAVASIDQFTNILDSMLQETQYENVVSDWTEWQDDGTNILRVLVYSVPAILSLIGLRYIEEENDTLINLCTNMSIISSGIYIVSMFTSGIFIGRLPIYFSLYSYILLPWEIEHMFTKESSRVLMDLLVVFYLIFYFYSIRG